MSSPTPIPTKRAVTVVVVDDNAEVLELAQRFLERHGFAVVTTSLPARASKLVREVDPDIIVLDVTMPGMDGDYLSRILRSDPANDPIPIVFYTALDIDEISHWMREIPGSKWVAKSEGIKSLHACIVTLLAMRNVTMPAPGSVP